MIENEKEPYRNIDSEDSEEFIVKDNDIVTKNVENEPVRNVTLTLNEPEPREVPIPLNEPHRQPIEVTPFPVEEIPENERTFNEIIDEIIEFLRNENNYLRERNRGDWTVRNESDEIRVVTVVPSVDAGWVALTLEERRELIISIGNIPSNVYCPDTVMTIIVYTMDGAEHEYPIAALHDNNVVLTVREYWDEYELRDGNGSELVSPMERIVGVSLQVVYRPVEVEPDLNVMQGNFFPYYYDYSCSELKDFFNTLEIFGENDWNPKENCFYMALVHWNEIQELKQRYDKMIPTETLGKIKFRLKGNGLSKSLLVKIGNDFKLCFNLTVVRMKHVKKNDLVEWDINTSSSNIGYIQGLSIYLGLIVIKEQGHYFVNSSTSMTKAGIEHYHELKMYSTERTDSLGRIIPAKSLDERLGVCTVKYVNNVPTPVWTSTQQPQHLCTADVLRIMIKHNNKSSRINPNISKRYLVEIPNYMLYRGCAQIVDKQKIIDVDLSPKKDPDIRLVEYLPKNSNDIIYVADTECVTQGRHRPYAIAFAKLEKDAEVTTFIGSDCMNMFIKEMERIWSNQIHRIQTNTKQHSPTDKDLIIYFHNLTYDGRMFCEQELFSITMGGNRIIEMKILSPTGKKITLRDSYMLINFKLAAFPKLFNLQEEAKQVFPYDYLTYDMFWERGLVMGKKYVNLAEIISSQQWSSNQIQEFKETLIENNIIRGDEVNVYNMIQCYIESDVRILQKGLLQFKNDLFLALKLDMTSYLSISSIAYAYLKRDALQGENVYEYTGEVRDFIRQAVYGGRCMTRGNLAYMVDGIEIDDIDACSLYPSAMSVMTIPKGAPKKKDYPTKQWLEDGLRFKTINAAIVRIKINHIGRPLRFPLICERNKDGVVMYDNYYGGEMVIDDIQLIELIKWQQIDYDLLECIYWDEGESTKIQDAIKHLYQKRKEEKQIKSTMEQVYKLIMNSSYGKCIEMPKQYKCRVVKGKNYITHLFQNYTNIQRIDEVATFDRSVVDPQQNRINEDSQYIFREYQQYDDFFVPTIIGVRILSMSKKLMNQVMVPAELEGILIFYQDTDSMHVLSCQTQQLEEAWRKHNNKSESDKLYGNDLCQFHSDFEPIRGQQTVSCGSIFLGKKMYIDKLVVKEPTEETLGLVKYMTRLKGIPNKSLLKKEIEGFETNDPKKLWKMYNLLFEGYSIPFELVTDRIKISFTRYLEVVSITTFVRKVNSPNCVRWKLNSNYEWIQIDPESIEYKEYN